MYDAMTVYFISFIVGIVVSCIFGAITKAINEGKGYYGGLLGVFGLVGLEFLLLPSNNQFPILERNLLLSQQKLQKIIIHIRPSYSAMAPGIAVAAVITRDISVLVFVV